MPPPDGALGTKTKAKVALPVRLDAAVELGQCYLAYALQCKRCGNLRMMGKQRVEELAASVDASEG